jgi:hypothetical protein
MNERGFAERVEIERFRLNNACPSFDRGRIERET